MKCSVVRSNAVLLGLNHSTDLNCASRRRTLQDHRGYQGCADWSRPVYTGVSKKKLCSPGAGSAVAVSGVRSHTHEGDVRTLTLTKQSPDLTARQIVRRDLRLVSNGPREPSPRSNRHVRGPSPGTNHRCTGSVRQTAEQSPGPTIGLPSWT
jgi:hypothetical protein